MKKIINNYHNILLVLSHSNIILASLLNIYPKKLIKLFIYLIFLLIYTAQVDMLLMLLCLCCSKFK